MVDTTRLKAAIKYACEMNKRVIGGVCYYIEEYEFYDDRIIMFCTDKIREIIISNIDKLEFNIKGICIEISVSYNGVSRTYLI